ncbi:hypothetical protein BD289DRAFT_233781 [Coniella lustricola]|uniref:Uncharacterized protein n=1 Tax=Coniella lustricola TaxID=2025994 RepID=A0A2T3AA35_9PEZI|nr:hypothetical protein BD289DRAFT_233781 [Coniella lustricola]
MLRCCIGFVRWPVSPLGARPRAMKASSSTPWGASFLSHFFFCVHALWLMRLVLPLSRHKSPMQPLPCTAALENPAVTPVDQWLWCPRSCTRGPKSVLLIICIILIVLIGLIVMITKHRARQSCEPFRLLFPRGTGQNRLPPYAIDKRVRHVSILIDDNVQPVQHSAGRQGNEAVHSIHSFILRFFSRFL